MAELRRFLIRRFLTFIPTLIGVTFIVYLIAAVVPANPARLWAGGQKANPQVIAMLVKEYHLNDPFYVQYYYFMKGFLENSMVSPVTGYKVWYEVKTYMPVTIQLTLISFVFILLIGIPLGIISALKKDTWIDATIRVVALVGVSVPIFWLAYLLIFLFFTKLGWITLSGTPTPPYSITGIPLIDSILKLDWHTQWEIIKRYWLPGIILAYPGIGVIARLVRNSFLDALGADFVDYVDARGLPKSQRYRHVLKNAMVPIITVLGLQFGGLLAGAPITETIFGLPGIGRFMLTSIYSFDYLSLMGGVFIIALIYMTVNLIVDILYALIDPRVRY
ncbi:MAG: ABC transporter permease [Desulfurococcales archaeon]|nr:ABC transporter permease [Desulfurococcales archaeon]